VSSPVIGICAAVERAGWASCELESNPTPRGSTPDAFCDHEVRLEPGSLAAPAAGAETTSAGSHQHQDIAELGEGLVASGWSLPHELIEAVELPDRLFVLEMLWHHEEDERDRVVGALVEQARVEAVAS
jgi:putative glutamine amidotransferase